MSLLVSIVLTGIGATMVMDIWGLVRKVLFGMPLANYALVGRWVAHMHHGQFYHRNIADSPPIQFEGALGWLIHYLVGIVFAAGLFMFCGSEWFDKPSLIPAVVFGAVTVVAPFLLMQPGMGAGIAARHTPKPWLARLHSVITHTVFGIGLYVAALALGFLSEGSIIVNA